MNEKIAINGFGRIGRNAFKVAMDKGVDVVAINDLTTPKTLAHLLKYDSCFGQIKDDVKSTEDSIIFNGKEIKIYAEKDPANLPWKALGVDVVIEATGFFTDGNLAKKHIDAGAKKVVISAPATNCDITIVMGVNENEYDPEKHNIISNASCTTNCLGPVVKAIDDKYTIEKGLMTTVHSYTGDQNILDAPHKDLRRSRAAGVSMIPTSTGAAKAIGLVLPHLNGKLNGFALRVPTSAVSVVDVVLELETATTVEEINQTLRDAANGPLDGVLGVCDEPLVSVDFKGDARSSIVDSLSTMMMGDKMVKVVSWYDNEWGYSNRIVDLVTYISK